MTKTYRSIRVFAGSPGDTSEERKVVREVVDTINRDVGRNEGYHLDLLLWEEDSYPDVGADPQSVIDRQIGDYDVFLGFMSTRFGSPTKGSGSGTEEEFHRAFAMAADEATHIKILFYFHNPLVRIRDIDPYQLLQVHHFRERLRHLGVLFHEYDAIEGARGFRELVNRHLVRAVRDLLAGTETVGATKLPTRPRQPLTVRLQDWTATTQHIYAQSSSFLELPLLQYPHSSFSLDGLLRTDCPYFRFGFKFLRPGAPLFGETTIHSRDDSLVLHVGRNAVGNMLFLTVYRGPSRTAPDKPFLECPQEVRVPITLSVSHDDVCTMVVGGIKVYEKQISREARQRLLVVAWGDEHGYEVHFEEIRLVFEDNRQ